MVDVNSGCLATLDKFIICATGKIPPMTHLTIIGGGLAGSEAAWQVAQNGFKVRLYEMRPANATPTGAHLGGD